MIFILLFLIYFPVTVCMSEDKNESLLQKLPDEILLEIIKPKSDDINDVSGIVEYIKNRSALMRSCKTLYEKMKKDKSQYASFDNQLRKKIGQDGKFMMTIKNEDNIGVLISYVFNNHTNAAPLLNKLLLELHNNHEQCDEVVCSCISKQLTLIRLGAFDESIIDSNFYGDDFFGDHETNVSIQKALIAKLSLKKRLKMKAQVLLGNILAPIFMCFLTQSMTGIFSDVYGNITDRFF
jgi:hypothetical protein